MLKVNTCPWQWKFHVMHLHALQNKLMACIAHHIIQHLSRTARCAWVKAQKVENQTVESDSHSFRSVFKTSWPLSVSIQHDLYLLRGGLHQQVHWAKSVALCSAQLTMQALWGQGFHPAINQTGRCQTCCKYLQMLHQVGWSIALCMMHLWVMCLWSKS